MNARVDGDVFSPKGKIPASSIYDVIQDAAGEKNRQATYVDEGLFPPCNYYGSFWVVLQQTVGTVMLALLGMAPLQAQAAKDLDSGLQDGSMRLDLGNGSTLRTPDYGFRFTTAPSIAAAVDATGPATEVSAESSTLDPSPAVVKLCVETAACGLTFAPEYLLQSEPAHKEPPELDNTLVGDSKNQPLVEMPRNSKLADFNRYTYYKNKLEFSLEGGWLPVNIPFPFDFLLGDGYNVTGVNYTLVPIIVSLRWQAGDPKGPWILRGNWDWSVSGAVTLIPRGPETRYFAYIMGVRRNFVQRRWRIVPYFDGRAGLGHIDAKGPYGVYGAQGQDFTFTLNLGSGVRYNFNPRYAISAGINWMHISNLYLSQPKFLNYGINVYGPLVGIDIRLLPHRRRSD